MTETTESFEPFDLTDIEDVRIIIKAKGKHWAVVPEGDEEYERILNVVKTEIEGFLGEKEIAPEKGLRYFWFSWSCEMSGTKGIVICSAYLSQREHPSIWQLRKIAANTGPKSSNIALVSLTEFKDEADFKAFTNN